LGKSSNSSNYRKTAAVTAKPATEVATDRPEEVSREATEPLKVESLKDMSLFARFVFWLVSVRL